MGFFKRKPSIKTPVQWRITKNCLDLILESSKSTYPNEFGGLLRVDDKEKNTIVEVVLIPGTVSGDSHAIFKMHMAPVDFLIVGTVHSHPGPSARPSQADLALFRKHGKVHIITATPFDFKSWRGFDQIGNQIEILLV